MRIRLVVFVFKSKLQIVCTRGLRSTHRTLSQSKVPYAK